MKAEKIELLNTIVLKLSIIGYVIAAFAYPKIVDGEEYHALYLLISIPIAGLLILEAVFVYRLIDGFASVVDYAELKLRSTTAIPDNSQQSTQDSYKNEPKKAYTNTHSNSTGEKWYCTHCDEYFTSESNYCPYCRQEMKKA